MKACGADSRVRRWAYQKSKEDILWWINTFCWIYEPRAKRKLPWITWPYQDEAITTIKQWFGVKDIGCEKSRDQGATWMFLAHIAHEFQFGHDSSWLLISRNEKLVDTKGDPDSLFWKLDFFRETQPPFLLPPAGAIERFELKQRNLRDNVVVSGASTTGDVGAGGRRTGVFIDEFGRFEKRESFAVNAATAPNTNSRAMCSTYQGAEGAFYEQMQRTDDDFVKITLPWTLHPEKMRGAEKDTKNRLGFTSPWYRKECRRLQVPMLIAQELDMNPIGSQDQFFKSELLERLRTECRPPIFRGSLIYDATNLKKSTLVENPKGDIILWCGADGRIPAGEKYGAGSDVSFGGKSTPSILSIGNVRTREKVCEVARADLSPDQWAELVVAVCWLFNEAFLIWENNGPGGPFGRRVIDLGYRKIYIRQDEQGLVKKLSANIVPGWNSNGSSKLALLVEYSRCLDNQSFVNRSLPAIKECEQYIFLPTGMVTNSRAVSIHGGSEARENHGDRVIADALCCKAMGPEPETGELREMPDFSNPFQEVPNPTPHSFEWLMQQDQRRSTESTWESNPSSLRGWDENPATLQGW